MHIFSYESGVLEDPAVVPPSGIYKMTRDLSETDDYPSTIDVSFEKGLVSEKLIPNIINSNKIKSVSILFDSLNNVDIKIVQIFFFVV